METSLLKYLLELQKPQRKRKNKSQPRLRAKTNYERTTPMTMTEEVKAPRHTGVVIWFKARDRGYGFLQDDMDASQVFVHISSVERSGLNDLREGQKVRYDIENDRKTGKTKAIKIELIS
jgi:cold shock protein